MTNPDNFIYNSNYKYNTPVRTGSLAISETTWTYHSLDTEIGPNTRFNVGFEYVVGGETRFSSSRFSSQLRTYVLNGVLYAGVHPQASGALVEGTFHWRIYGD